MKQVTIRYNGKVDGVEGQTIAGIAGIHGASQVSAGPVASTGESKQLFERAYSVDDARYDAFVAQLKDNKIEVVEAHADLFVAPENPEPQADTTQDALNDEDQHNAG